MNEFDPWKILCHSSPSLDGDETFHWHGEDVSDWIAPVMLCAWNRGFYVQTIIWEFDFEKYIPKHPSKRSIVFIGRPAKKRTLIHPDGKSVSYPVLSVIICINRGMFPQRNGSDEIEWLKIITPRTTALAHELLYADQYANLYDYDNQKLLRPLVVPHPPVEQELLCPSYEIENLLHTVETRYKNTSFKTALDFQREQTTLAAQMYYRSWLQKHAVDDNLCENRTNAYLDSGVRDHYPKIKEALDESMKKFNVCRLAAYDFLKHMMDPQPSPFASDFLGRLEAKGCLTPFQKLHERTCIASFQHSGNHKCAALFHQGHGQGCSVCRCDITHHTLILMGRNEKPRRA